VSAPSITAADYVRAIVEGYDGLAATYGEWLDEPRVAELGWYERPEALLLCARHYVTAYRLRVLPLAPGTKKPLGGRCCGGMHERGVSDALADRALVEGVWARHPRANVGIATGYRVDVVDQDGREGAVSWAQIGRADAWPRVLGVVNTPRAGGVHRYVAATGDGNGAHIAPGLDYRGRGGYVVAPPSIVDGRRYSWLAPLDVPNRAR
jgi:hypothetical protein